MYDRNTFFKLRWLIVFLFFSSVLSAQVILRDSTVTWKHHRFDLNEDGSINTFSTSDQDIQTVTFAGKVLENELIKLVLIPEYGGRILSFVYKPTGHEYLYQSEVGSAYGINAGNFYYNWLMVYGGIFPTFPEPEHGKTWFLPWEYSVIKDKSDTVTIRMEYTDNTSYSGAPGGFNNGITGITCSVDVSVYSQTSIWDFDVKLTNNRSSSVNYEYWTCTTLTPGSEVGDTGSPLNSEIVIPANNYFAGWSPGGWIGGINSTYNMSDIDYLFEWDDMGIAYASNFDGKYWGVLNHENNEGVFRISENVNTKGLKLWTWGSGNVDNNLYDYSNGGADNYIELWAGVSDAFFRDATMAANEVKTWKESYCATVGLSSIVNMNEFAAANLIWDENQGDLTYELNTFSKDNNYTLTLNLEGVISSGVATRTITFQELGVTETISVTDLGLPSGAYLAKIDLTNDQDELVFSANKWIQIINPLSTETFKADDMEVLSCGGNSVQLIVPESGNYHLSIVGLDGRIMYQDRFNGNSKEVRLPQRGLYVFQVGNGIVRYNKKVLIN